MTGPQAAVDPAGSPHSSFPHRPVLVTPAAHQKLAGQADTDEETIDVAHLEHQREWSRETFGPGDRRKGVLDHIRKELVEIEEAGERTDEWFDVVILALDGAWRDGYEPAEIIAAIKAKQAKNERRTWPDWRTADPDRAIEHVRAAALEAGAGVISSDCRRGV